MNKLVSVKLILHVLRVMNV